MRLLNAKNPTCYDGFEPSGRMHIAQGVMKALNVNKLTKAGCTFKFWIADWFAMLNNKMGGDLKKIRNVGQYMIEVRIVPPQNTDAIAYCVHIRLALHCAVCSASHGDDNGARTVGCRCGRRWGWTCRG
jgi:hypothetical protein